MKLRMLNQDKSIFKNRLSDHNFNPYLDSSDYLLGEEVRLLMTKEEELQEDIRLERKEAHEEGFAEGLENGIKLSFELLLETGIAKETAVECIARKYGITAKEVSSIISK